jgi:hypothetical protein
VGRHCLHAMCTTCTWLRRLQQPGTCNLLHAWSGTPRIVCSAPLTMHPGSS